jgi:hypothetical protein
MGHRITTAAGGSDTFIPNPWADVWNNIYDQLERRKWQIHSVLFECASACGACVAACHETGSRIVPQRPSFQVHTLSE